RLPRLCESLADPTRGAAQSHRSEVVINSMRDLLPRSWIWVPEHRRYSHPLRFIPTPSLKELGITFCTGIGIAYVTTIQNRHFETVDRALVSRNSLLGPKFPRSMCTSTPTAVPSGRMWIFIRPRLPRLCESLADPTRGATQSQRSEVVFNSMQDLLPSSDSLDYANRWRSPHAEPPSHSDQKSCSTRREISSPGRGYGCPNIADIVSPSGLFPPLQRKNWA
ncbi:hypothetical protein Taro_056097, partial [Colocasia esculenta]|nr:hypothetical protein [Colocasia esculenta]